MTRGQNMNPMRSRVGACRGRNPLKPIAEPSQEPMFDLEPRGA
jgi:hypothetical protein